MFFVHLIESYILGWVSILHLIKYSLYSSPLPTPPPPRGAILDWNSFWSSLPFNTFNTVNRVSRNVWGMNNLHYNEYLAFIIFSSWKKHTPLKIPFWSCLIQRRPALSDHYVHKNKIQQINKTVTKAKYTTITKTNKINRITYSLKH